MHSYVAGQVERELLTITIGSILFLGNPLRQVPSNWSEFLPINRNTVWITWKRKKTFIRIPLCHESLKARKVHNYTIRRRVFARHQRVDISVVVNYLDNCAACTVHQTCTDIYVFDQSHITAFAHA